MSSGLGRGTFDDGFDLRAFGLSDKRFFGHDLGDKIINVGLFGEIEEINAF